MKIAHFIYDHVNNPWVGGGGAVRVMEINKRLAKLGHSVTIVSGNFPGAKSVTDRNLNVIFVGKSYNYFLSTFSYAYESYRFLNRNVSKYDIVVEDFAPWNPVFSYTKQKNCAIILQIQNYIGLEILKKYYFCGIPFYLIELLYPKLFSNIIVLSEQLNRRWQIEGKVIAQGIKLLSVSCELGDYVGYLGRFDIQQKGLDLLVKAASQLKSIEIRIAGDGRDRQHLIRLASGRDNITLVGWVSGLEKDYFISRMRFLVLPSRFEGQGIVALEAAAMGKPVVVSDIPELKYVVDNGFGISFRKGDSEDLAEKIRYLWDRPDLIREMGERGRRYASQFTWDRIADEYERYLYQVLNQR